MNYQKKKTTPVNVANGLEKLQRDFLWGGLVEERNFIL
jgi:hypothetical protein